MLWYRPVKSNCLGGFTVTMNTYIKLHFSLLFVYSTVQHFELGKFMC